MSGQPSLITLALDAEVQRPRGILIQRQFYRDKAVQGSGTYKAMDENGNIEIVGGPGSGMIMGGGTLNFIPKFTPDGQTLGNSALFDNGNIGYGTITPNALAAFDIVSTTKGILIPRMTTVQRDAIATGATTNGLLIYNTTTGKFNFWNQGLGIWESIDTSTGGDVSGSGTTNFIPRWTDGPNSVLGDSIVRDNGTIAAVNRAVVVGTTLAIQGATANAAEYGLEVYNSTPIVNFAVRNDGKTIIGNPASALGNILDVATGAGTLDVNFISDISSQINLIGVSSQSYMITNGFNGTWFEIMNLAGTVPYLQINTNGNTGIGNSTVAPKARLNVIGADNGAVNFALLVENAALADLFRVRNDGVLHSDLQPTFADNAAAIVGGLIAGDWYLVVDAVTGSKQIQVVQ